MTKGRPFRFLATALGGWTTLRIVALWPVAMPAITAIRAVLPSAAAETVALAPITVAAMPVWRRAVAVRSLPQTRQASALPRETVAAVSLPLMQSAEAPSVAPALPTIAPPLAPTPLATSPSRWAGSAWLIVRDGGGGGLLGGQLGGSQGGARLTYALDQRHRIALAGRVATPLHGRGREAGIGVDWQPLRIPLHVIVEQRLALDSGRGGPTLEVVGGFGPREVTRGIVAEGYGQAGVIARDGGEPFADGALRLTHRLVERGRVRLDAGVGAWGGAQRYAARLDVGPSLGMVAPLGDKAVRLTLDWRQRVAGQAAPGSGPALSIGSDF